ncbi:FeoA family protein [Eggerthella sinensis]|uniref:FeoA family protein n=1 Tax=Eggerthella sinensis TaxID=242230 RepID=UPI0022E58DD6|nr:FeoA family protein [Eggerthella sinensis]
MAKLNETAAGDAVVISGVRGDARFVSRVTSIGLTEGCEVRVLQNVRKRPLLVYGRDSIIALDAGDCERIDVEARS